MAQDIAWLREELVKALEWEPFLVEGVVDGIVKANDRASVDPDIIDNFLSGNSKALAVIDRYFQTRTSSKATSGLARKDVGYPSIPSAKSSDRSFPLVPPEGFSPYVKADRGDLVYISGSAQRGRGKAVKNSPLFIERAQGSDPPVPTIRFAEETSSSSRTKKVGKSRTARPGVVRRDDQQLKAADLLERKVVNCLECGKIYDCRQVSNEVIRFLDTGGVCGFCGAQVELIWVDGGHVERVAPPDEEQREVEKEKLLGVRGTASHTYASGGESHMDDATRAAVAFKDRLVDYDRNASRRTTVIDDQSDYFEIDNNTWLTEEEREDLRRRKVIEEAADEERRKRRGRITLDLIGRQVIYLEGVPGVEEEEQQEGNAPGTRALGARIAPLLDSRGHVHGVTPGVGGLSPQVLQSTAGVDRCDADAAMHVVEAARKLRTMRITVCPGLDIPPPVFLASSWAKAGCQETDTLEVAGTNRRTPGPGGSSDRVTLEKPRRGHKVKSRALSNSRIQHDDVFDEFGEDMLYDEVIAM